MYHVHCKFCSDTKIYQHRSDFSSSTCPTCSAIALNCRSYKWIGLSDLVNVMQLENIRIDTNIQKLMRKVLENEYENF